MWARDGHGPLARRVGARMASEDTALPLLWEAYRWLEELLHDPVSLHEYVTSRTGVMVPVSWPLGCGIRLGSHKQLGYFDRRQRVVCEDGT